MFCSFRSASANTFKLFAGHLKRDMVITPNVAVTINMQSPTVRIIPNHKLFTPNVVRAQPHDVVFFVPPPSFGANTCHTYHDVSSTLKLIVKRLLPLDFAESVSPANSTSSPAMGANEAWSGIGISSHKRTSVVADESLHRKLNGAEGSWLPATWQWITLAVCAEGHVYTVCQLSVKLLCALVRAIIFFFLQISAHGGD